MTGRIHWLPLAIVPATIIASFAGVGDFWLFLLSVASLVPLAYLIGEATERAGEHTGPAIAGLLNASFGNAPELIISLFAVERGLFEFVRGSLVGSVVSNLLLVLGVTIVAGGGGRLDRRSGFRSLTLTAVATGLFLVPGFAHHWHHADRRFLPVATLPVVLVLIVAYLLFTAHDVRRQARAHRAEESDESPAWTLRQALVALAVAAVATAWMSEILTGSVESFSRTAHLDDFFVAAVIVALVGNAAEHGGAVVIAMHGNLRLASEIAFSSSAQVALFVIPAVVLLSLPMSPLPLAFRPAELAALGLALLVPAVALVRGRVARPMGGLLVAAYSAVAVGFYVVA